ncbi:MAG: thiolase family protein [Gammaproteobacteria bacterium]|nr:thiolase family protein [Gammaproteobacteria bacterium]
MPKFDPVYIAGVGMTKFGLYPERSIKAMVREAVERCLSDASARPSDVEGLYFGNVGQAVIEGQAAAPGQIALRPLGFETAPITNLENGCASGSSALWLAVMQIRAGMADIALAVGTEKLSTDDVARRESLFLGGFDVHDREGVFRELARFSEGTDSPSIDGPRSAFMDIYGHWARAHMRDFGSTQEQLATIASKNHWHSTMNPLCQFQRPFTVEEVLAGRPLAYPLTVPMCSPYSDGAAATLVCSRRGLEKLGVKTSAVTIRALVQVSGTDRDYRDWDRHITRLAADRAYEEASVSPADIDFAEVHDATAFGELLNAENLGLVPRGEGGIAAMKGETRLGGRIPINPSGGLESRGHPLGATGLAQVHEIVTQLRGRAGERQIEGARLGITENGGGLYGIEEAAAVVGIFAARGE